MRTNFTNSIINSASKTQSMVRINSAKKSHSVSKIKKAEVIASKQDNASKKYSRNFY